MAGTVAGSPGPQGIQGETGPQGIQGEPGSQTPWLSDIAAGWYNLTSIGNITGELHTYEGLQSASEYQALSLERVHLFSIDQAGSDSPENGHGSSNNGLYLFAGLNIRETTEAVFQGDATLDYVTIIGCQFSGTASPDIQKSVGNITWAQYGGYFSTTFDASKITDYTPSVLNNANSIICGGLFWAMYQAYDINNDVINWNPPIRGGQFVTEVYSDNPNILQQAGYFDVVNNIGDVWNIYVNTPFGKNLLGKDDVKTIFGTGEDASIYYDGDDLIINPKEVGSGTLSVLGDIAATNLNIANWDIAYGWGDHAGLYSLLGHTHSGVYEPAFAAGTSSQYRRGDKTWQTLNQAAVSGLTTTSSPTFAGLTLATADGHPNISTLMFEDSTSNATPKTTVISIPEESATLVEARVVAKSTGGTSAAYILKALFEKSSGTVSQVGSTTVDFSVEEASAWNCTLAVSSGQLCLTVTGAAATTILWEGIVLKQSVYVVSE